MKLATVYAPIGATIGEWVGSSQGLGYLMLLANGRVKTDLMFAAMLTLGVMSVTLYALISMALDRLIDYERPS
jgi:putative hydroxymethylpyrimidine transport system permease protein